MKIPISFVNGSPAIIVENERTVVAGDLHIGMETRLEDSKMAFPRASVKMAQELLSICTENGCDRLVLLGDVKDRLSNMTSPEMQMLRDFFNVLSSIDVRIVRGNHDANLDQILSDMGFRIEIKREILIGDVALMHGNALPSQEAVMKKYIICGHGHIAAHLNGVDSKAWLVAGRGEGMERNYKGFERGIKLVAAPAFNRLIIGSRVGAETEEHLPMLNRELFDFAHAIFYDLYGNRIDNKR